MYEQFYGLTERPFDLTPNPRFLFLSPEHREAMSNLEYGLDGRKGITLLIGDAGVGKTTLIRAVVSQRGEQDAQLIYINNPKLTRNEFIRTLATGFDLSADAATDKAVFLRELEQKLHARYAEGKLTALVIDEAQSLPHDLLEEVRLLANIETERAKLLPVILAGQPELADRLNNASLRQLKQRIALRCELMPLNLQKTAAYIATRIRTAGGQPGDLFTQQAIGVIYQASKGIPRTIGVLCDNALLSGFALGERPITGATVLEVCRDFDINPATAAEGPRGTADAAVRFEPSRADELRPVAVPAQSPSGPETVGEAKSPDLFRSFNRRQKFSFF
jgi:general secretion pathway protein A